MLRAHLACGPRLDFNGQPRTQGRVQCGFEDSDGPTQSGCVVGGRYFFDFFALESYFIFYLVPELLGQLCVVFTLF